MSGSVRQRWPAFEEELKGCQMKTPGAILAVSNC